VETALWHTQQLGPIGQLTGGIAHDFNNLLMVISGNLELVLEALDSAAKLSSARRAQLRQLLNSAEVAIEQPPRSRSSFPPSRSAASSRRRPSVLPIYWRSRRAFWCGQRAQQSRPPLPAHRTYGFAGSIQFSSPPPSSTLW
jgi:hypothetical protein